MSTTPSDAPSSPSSARQPGASCTEQRDAFGILSHCHDQILLRLDQLEATARELAQATELTDGPLARLCEVLAFLDTAIPMHSADEEQTLFPRLRELPQFAQAGGTPMDCMEEEHVTHAAVKAQLKRAIVNRDTAPLSRCMLNLVTEYRSHIDKEEGILYPMAKQLLTDPALVDRMTDEMRARRRDVRC